MVTPSGGTRIYKLYDTEIRKDSSFSYLSVPIKPGGFIDYANIVQRNINRLGWLPGGKSKSCIQHPGQHWSRSLSFECLNIFDRLFLPTSIDDPISFLLNFLLPTTKPRSPVLYGSSIVRWPLLCQILHELDYTFHDGYSPPTDDPGQKLLEWFLKR